MVDTAGSEVAGESWALLAQSLLEVGGDYAGQFGAWLTQQAERHWSRREESMQGLSTAAQIRERQGYVRRTMLELIGGLPAEKTPLNARVTRSFARDGYRVENVIFESQPGFLVTANLYLPTVGRGPFPAFIGFVRQGFAVLAFDPPGQGERLEYLDPETAGGGGGRAQHGGIADAVDRTDAGSILCLGRDPRVRLSVDSSGD